ncbi:MAG TPA: GAP family protein [Gaiellaceae bacterium]|nr:GAP family protein [Gaiellaceae bacterium]
MGQAIGDVLPLAIGVALSPVPIIAIILMLGTPRARSTGLAFALGWLAGLTIAGAIMLALASGNADSSSGGPATWVSVLKLVLGILFLLLAVKQWRGRPQPGQEPTLPKWMQTIDTFTPGKSLGIGVVLSGLNPKNLALTIAAATVIAQAGISHGQEAGVLAVFILLGSLTILAPLGIYLALGSKATQILQGMKTWMSVHNGAIMTVLLLVLGAKLTGDAISGFSS